MLRRVGIDFTARDARREGDSECSDWATSMRYAHVVVLIARGRSDACLFTTE